MAISIGLQLYSVRKEFEADYKNTLKRVADLGFEGVEFAGFYEIKASDLKLELDRLNLKAAGSHTSYDLLCNQLEEVILYNKEIGNRHIVCPVCAFPTKEALDEVVVNFKKIAARLKEEGFTFSYHNHSHEFEKIEGSYIIDKLFEEVEELLPQLDVYWVYRGDENVKDYVKKYKDKMILIHLKDGSLDGGSALLEGNVDIKGVIEVIKDSGIQWAIVEDETPYPNSFDSVERSIQNIKGLF